ncbi:hypothetical protein EON64_14330 [archaeon]|nr:MAG: hypothetical protein EON64_14330 [archaeon]
MHLAAKSDMSTGNSQHASYMLQSGDVRMLFTAPYASQQQSNEQQVDAVAQSEGYLAHTEIALPGYDSHHCQTFFAQHGMAVKSVAIEVADVLQAYNTMVKHGAVPALSPRQVQDTGGRGHVHMAAVTLYGDVTLRILNSDQFSGHFLPNFLDMLPAPQRLGLFGIERFDHVVGNVPVLREVVDYVQRITVSWIYRIYLLVFMSVPNIGVFDLKCCRASTSSRSSVRSKWAPWTRD